MNLKKREIDIGIADEDRKKIYRLGFLNGCKEMDNRKRPVMVAPPNKKVIGFTIARPKPSQVQSVINKVCIHFEVHKETLMNKTRTADVVRARNVIHNMLFEKYSMTLSDIGRYFGQDHTTVLHSIEMKKNKRRFWDSGQSIWEEFADLKATIS